MENWRIFVVLFVIGVIQRGDGKEICPRMCTCDVFEGYKRADCR
jgi:hypothetical protein